MPAPLKSGLLVALFVASFLVTAFCVRAALGVPAASGMRKKVVHYEADPAGFDVVFVGSSNVMNSIIPELFDAELRARGYELRSYNLGLPGMLAFETDHLLQRVLARRPARLRHVFVELTDWRPTPWLAEPTERCIHWHTFERFVAMAQAALVYEHLDRAARWSFLRENGELTLWRLANAGRVHERLMRELGMNDPDLWEALMETERERGYLALEEVGHPGADQGHAEFLAEPERYKQLVAALRAQPPPSGPPAAYLARSAERRLAFFADTGVEPIHLLLPTSQTTERLEALRAPAGPLAELWAFNRPDEYRDLYRPLMRFDTRHLKRPGAEVLTRLLAARFADHLDAAAER